MHSVTAACASCARPLSGRYCAHCGEEAVGPHALTVRHFVTHTLAHETVHLDGKIWRTLRYLFFRPGFLTAEYCAGRRRVYVNPVRILITAIIAYAVLMPAGNMQLTLWLGHVNLNLAPSSIREGTSIAETLRAIDRRNVLGRLYADRSTAVDLTTDAARERFHAKLHAFAQPLSFSNTILLALVLFAFFHWKQPLLVAHGVFSMHFVSFVLLSSVILLAPFLLLLNGRLSIVAVVFVLIGVVSQFVYLGVAVRRFYFAGDARRFLPGLVATASAILLYLVNSAFVTGIQMLGGALALWSVSRPVS